MLGRCERRTSAGRSQEVCCWSVSRAAAGARESATGSGGSTPAASDAAAASPDVDLEGARDVAVEYLEALKARDAVIAYGFFSDAVQAEVPFEQFIEQREEAYLFARELGPYEVGAAETDGDRVVVGVDGRASDGRPFAVRLPLVPDGTGSWAVDELPREF